MKAFLILLALLLIFTGCNKNHTDLSENSDFFSIINKKNDFPFVDKKCKYIGDSYELLKKKGDIYPYDIEVTSGLPSVIYDTEEDGITYFAIKSNEYIGIKNDRVVVYTFYAGEKFVQTPTVRDLLYEDEFYTQELFVVERNNYVDLYWELSNGYLIISAMPWGEDYYSYAAMFMTFTESLEQCPIEKSESIDHTSNKLSKWDYSEFATAPFEKGEFWDSQKENENWYDNGIFSTFISIAYPKDSWYYLSDTYPDIKENPYDYMGFQVYVRQSKKNIYYYLVPINPATPAEVYAYDNISNEMKLVFSNGKVLD